MNVIILSDGKKKVKLTAENRADRNEALKMIGAASDENSEISFAIPLSTKNKVKHR